MGNENNKMYQLIDTKPKACCDKFSLCINNKKVDPSEVTCAICFTIFTAPRIMKCKHIFCQNCIHEWGKGNSATCPYCRIKLKRNKGSFGRVDKKTQKKIDLMILKCRNCCWTGSYCEFITSFNFSPYLDDDLVPEQVLEAGKEGEIEQICIDEQKKEPLKKLEEAEKIELREQKLQMREVEQKEQSRGYDMLMTQLFKVIEEEQVLDRVMGDNLFYSLMNEEDLN